MRSGRVAVHRRQVLVAALVRPAWAWCTLGAALLGVTLWVRRPSYRPLRPDVVIHHSACAPWKNGCCLDAAAGATWTRLG